MKIGILGGGITGLTLQRFLRYPSVVLERSDSPGGLCRTYFKDGFGYDLGGHILFSKNERINKLVEELLAGNIDTRKRANKILYKNRFIKYPFENDLAALGKEEAYECLLHYLRNDYPKPEANLKQWAYYTFGKAIAEKYFIPYNEKIWNIPADQLSLEFVERIPKPPMEDVVKSAIGIETEGYLHQLHFKYPKRGGVESLVRAVMKKDAAVTCGYAIEKISKTSRGWEVTNGASPQLYDRIVVTFPIHEAVNCFDNVPAPVRQAVAGLRYNSMRVVLIAVNDESLLDFSAVYIPDPAVCAHRVCYMGFFSRELVRPGTSSLIAEITTNPGDGIHELGDEEITRRVIDDLHRIKLIDRSKVIATDVRRVKYAYPVYDLHYTKNIGIVREYFASIGVDLCGRFAEFVYINSDECMRKAVDLADQLNAGS